MDHQETQLSPGMGVRLGELLHDAVTLTELQCQLLGQDVSRCARRSFRGAALAVGGCVIVLATLPVLLLGTAYLVAELSTLSLAVSILLTGCVSVAMGVVACGLGYYRLRHAADAFDRSRQELRANVSWLKHTLKGENDLPEELGTELPR